MAKKKPDLYQRPDGLYEKGLTINSKRVRFRGKSEKEILQKIAAYEEKEEKGPLFSQIAQEWYEGFVAEHPASIRSVKAHYNRLIKKFGNERIKDITTIQLTNYLSSLNYAKNTVENCKSIASNIFKLAIAQGCISNNPSDYSKIPSGLKKEERKFPTEHEINVVKQSYDLPYGLYPYFALYTGLRRGEMLALKYGDIDFDNNRIIVNKSIYHNNNRPTEKQTKTFKGTRAVILLDILRDKIPKGQPKDSYIFGGEKPWTATAVQRHMETYCRHASINIGVHQLRHAYATILYEAGIDERMAMELMGHANISTTKEIYTHISKQKNNQVMQQLNAFVSK